MDELRSNWLNPPEWTREEVLEFPGSVSGPWRRYIDPATVSPLPNPPRERGVSLPPARGGTEGGIGTVRYPRRVAKDDECAKQLAKRTLTNLYNQRPTWLAQAHERLDAAVFAAYGWTTNLSDEQILEKLLTLNLQREPAKAATK